MVNMNFTQLSPFVKQYAIIIAVNLSVLSTGFGFAWSSPVLVKLRDQINPVLSQPITEVEGSWIVSIGFISGLVANFLAIYLLDHVGRKFSLFFGTVPKILCYAILIFATEVWMVLLARLLNGIADSFTFGVVPVYASEIASKEIRGGLGSSIQVFSSLGIVIVLAIGPFISFFALNLLILISVIAATIPLIFLPETPYFLHKKGKTEEAIKVLTNLRGTKANAKEEAKEYASMDETKNPKISEVLQSRTTLKALAMVVIMNIGFQLTGFNVLSFYLQTILESTNSSFSSELASVIIGCIELAGTFFTTLINDRFGRKPIVIVSLIGTTIGLIGLGTFFKLTENGVPSGFINYLPLISLVLVVFSMSAGLCSLIWPLSSELFDGPARAIGINTGMITSYILMFAITRFYPEINGILGPATTYWLFSVVACGLMLFILFFVPETGGKTFSEIQVALGSDCVRNLDVKFSS